MCRKFGFVLAPRRAEADDVLVHVQEVWTRPGPPQGRGTVDRGTCRESLSGRTGAIDGGGASGREHLACDAHSAGSIQAGRGHTARQRHLAGEADPARQGQLAGQAPLAGQVQHESAG